MYYSVQFICRLFLIVHVCLISLMYFGAVQSYLVGDVVLASCGCDPAGWYDELKLFIISRGTRWSHCPCRYCND